MKLIDFVAYTVFATVLVTCGYAGLVLYQLPDKETCVPTDHKRVWTRSRYSTEDDMKLVEMEKTTHRKWACPGSEDEWRGE